MTEIERRGGKRERERAKKEEEEGGCVGRATQT